MPILWVGALVIGGVAILLVVLTLTHMKSPDQPAHGNIVAPSTAAPAPARPTPVAPPCYPLQPC
ncbi:hypothetical protein BJY24_005553 [Nocardia transvalensis]|uniref:Uncharacterized protein n=1 Tax=Nocardia transvalensis TaxID=37333 RepID=A0A7W9PIB8_9NOCA|nr:hypothetical protein [Nocardia transvalensis]MBB5916641.1 hypothetical protein [Nocardia transvalensis]